jgi:hypothetical protein
MPGGRVVKTAELYERDPLARPYVLKPVNEGSSVGVAIVTAEGNYGNPISPQARGPWQEFDELLAEPFIRGRELTTAVLGDRALMVTELIPKTAFYDFDAKYTDGLTEHVCPADIPEDIAQACKDIALRAHKLLGCKGTSRSDFRWDDERGVEGLFLLEVNTQPGMTRSAWCPSRRGIWAWTIPIWSRRSWPKRSRMPPRPRRRRGPADHGADDPAWRQGRAARGGAARGQGQGADGAQADRLGHRPCPARAAVQRGNAAPDPADADPRHGCRAGVDRGQRGRVPALLESQVARAAHGAGFDVKRVEVRGVKRMSEQTIYEKVLGQRDQAMSRVDVAALRETLLTLPWVKDARVSRQLPDTLVVDVVERTPTACCARATS